MGRYVIALVCAAALSGCGQNRDMTLSQLRPPGIRLLEMTRLEPDASGEGMVLRAFVQPDGMEQEVRYRFELYAYKPQSANPRGKRIALWPDIEIAADAQSNSYWRQHLRAYEFVLPVEKPTALSTTVVLEITALGESGLWSDILKLRTKAQ